jgi:TatD DNase family protein
MSTLVHGWTDTHCHIHDDKMTSTSAESLQRAREAGVSRFVVIGTDAATSEAAIAIAAEHTDVWATVGLHPHDAVNGVNTITSFVSHPRVVAIGECGLDYYYEHSPREVQLPVFAEQIALAKEHNLTLVIHTRDAWQDTFDVLDAEGIPENTIIHCFSGGPDEAKQCLDRGAYLSFSGIVTFKNAQDLRDAAIMCPSDRLLIETDSPFLAPLPHRGRPNEPAYVGLVGTAIADLRSTNVQEFAQQTTANALAAFPRLHS